MAKTASVMKRAGTTTERGVSASLQRHFDKENARVAELMSKRDGSITMDNGQILEKDMLKGMMMNLRDVKANGTLYEDFAYDILYTDGKQAHYVGGDDTSRMKLTGIRAVIEDNGSTLISMLFSSIAIGSLNPNSLIDSAICSTLSDSERENALSKLYDLTTKQLEAEARTENPYATGRGVARFDRQLARARGDDAVYARVKVEEHMREVRDLNLSNQRKAHQQAIETATKNALESKALEYTVNGVTYRRKSTRSKTFERVY